MVGDAFGAMLRAAFDHQQAGKNGAVPEVVERDDGVIAIGPAAVYLAPPAQWPDCEQQAVERLAGRVLDVGAGAGRVALLLQEGGTRVTALDNSRGAIEVCQLQGVRETVCATIDQHATGGERYDSFALFGRNLGLLESRERAPVVLETLAGMARSPAARIVGVGMAPPAAADPATVAYADQNRASGRLPGQRKLRSRFGVSATPWFDYLWCSADELAELVAGSRWRLTGMIQGTGPTYAAILELRTSVDTLPARLDHRPGMSYSTGDPRYHRAR